MKPERAEKFKRVVARRQPNLTVILENVIDPHNIGAVLRSCDSVGIMEIFVLYTEPHLQELKELPLGKRTSAGARKWVDVHFYTNTEACFTHVRSQYDRVLCTHLHEDATPLYKLDLTTSLALLFGNEHSGVSEEVRSHCDGNFLIPQMGMVESLNISVACAVTLYEALRQRECKGYYGPVELLGMTEQEDLFEEFVRRHDMRYKQARVFKSNPED